MQKSRKKKQILINNSKTVQNDFKLIEFNRIYLVTAPLLLRDTKKEAEASFLGIKFPHFFA